MGDYADAILRTDLKRFSGSSNKDELQDMLDSMLNEQRDLVIRKFKRLSDAGRLLGMLEGNHEESIKKMHQYDILKDVCRALDVPWLGYSCFFKLNIQGYGNTKKDIVIYAHHGHGSSRKDGGSVNRFDDIVKCYDADIYLMGHDHKKWGKRGIKLGLNRDCRMIYKPYITARTGSFLRTSVGSHTTYSEKHNYPPVDLGVIKITLNFHTQKKDLDIHVSE